MNSEKIDDEGRNDVRKIGKRSRGHSNQMMIVEKQSATRVTQFMTWRGVKVTNSLNETFAKCPERIRRWSKRTV